jgi:glycine/D-amino acid oxidase-like deaminating enzyme
MGCLWLAQVDSPECPPLERDVSADVCVVGGGYSGLWTALAAASSGARVVLVEAQRCGDGASGRNGGFALSWWAKLPALIARCGRDEAVRLAEASAAALDELPGFQRGGWQWTATTSVQPAPWDAAVAAGAPFAAVTGGVIDRAAGTVHPARLVQALRADALARGVAVFERTPMVSLDRDAGVVRTPSGSVRADAVVLATNAWLAGAPELRRAIAAVSSDVVATAPLPGGPDWSEGACLSDSRMQVRYWRASPDARVVLGRGGGALAYGTHVSSFDDPPARRTAAVAAELPSLVPAARGVPVEYAWGGAVDRSADGLPFFGVLPGRARVVYGVGFSGNGVGPCVVGGRVMASLALRRSDEWSQCGLARGVPDGVRFPPEPIRYLGGQLVLRAVGRKERIEHGGGRPGPIARGLASLAPKAR